MTEPTDLEATPAYSRQAVEEYLQRIEAERRELEEAIAVARDRTVRAMQMEKRILDLERRVGQLFVEAHVQEERQPTEVAVFTDASVASPPPPVHLGEAGVPGDRGATAVEVFTRPPPPPGWEAHGG
jgi:hypothetical protein